jgi:hypothetical protein
VQPRFANEYWFLLGDFDCLFPFRLKIQAEEYCRFVCGGFSLASPANDQSRGNSVAMRVGHDEMA